MSKKVLFISHVSNFQNFNWPFMQYFKDKGYIVHYASDGSKKIKYCDKSFSLSIKRRPLRLGNIRAIYQLRKILNKENYDLIHCHTPMGGVVARLATKKLFKKNKLKVIYTAHGFHFFKGSSKLSWIFFYNIEKYLSKYSNAIITINKEDYITAKENFKSNIYLIDGVGVNLDNFSPVSYEDKNKLRNIYKYNENDFIIIMVAEYTKNKNHKFLIESIKELSNSINNMKVLLAGVGDEYESISNLINSYGLNNTIYQLGYRRDIPSLLNISDVLVVCSYREGLPVNLIEAEACGVIPVATNIRGVKDVIDNEKFGYLYPINNKDLFIDKIKYIYNNKSNLSNLRNKIINRSKKYSVELAIKNMDIIYNEVLYN